MSKPENPLSGERNRIALHVLEERVLRTLQNSKDAMSVEGLSSSSAINVDQARRAVEWLKSKGLVYTKETLQPCLYLGREGEKALSLGLPERRLVKALQGREGKVSAQDLLGDFDSHDEFSAALGRARELGWVRVASESGILILSLLATSGTSSEEKMLKRLRESPIKVEDLDDEMRKALPSLKRRPGYVEVREEKRNLVLLTEAGRTFSIPKEETMMDSLSPELLASGEWRKYVLRPFDVGAPSPPVFPGKKHPVQRVIDEVREIFVSLGFEEVEGPIVQPCFWNFDALFIPQDHQAREMQDTFYLADIEAEGSGGALRKRVARVHEDGGDTGSRGWGYRWREEGADRLVLRTHTTAVTVEYLARYKPKEARVFSIGRVFRNEKVTYKNLVEFHQIEGIVVGRKVSLRDMMGLLGKFYERLGLKKVKFWPSYFPYTEPSLQSVVYHEGLGRWVELCGMGIFRPEVTYPLGVKNPVLAWGGGLERLVMMKYGLDDVRELYANRLSWLRRVSLCQS